ncbi:MAG: hypothetical protein K8S94_00460 [Planctomycetia bacterium]|nr:hypothetical protein [Planctomycetia bacterium]
MTAVVWIIALLAVGLGMLVLEVFVPSGGVLGFLSVVALGAGVATAFVEQGPWIGTLTLAATCVAAPLALALAFRLFPQTPLGRRVLPPPPRPDEVVPDADRRALLRDLVGRSGRATSDLLPWGSIEIDGIEHTAFSESGPITRGESIEAVGVQATALVVRARVAPPPIAPRSDGPPAEPTPGPQAVPRHLEEALEAFDFDALGRVTAAGNSTPAVKLDSAAPLKQS